MQMDQNKQQEEDAEVFGALYQPSGLYNDTLQQILQGLLSGIILHHGKLEQVKREDILAGTNIAPVTLDQYFKGPDSIMAEVYNELCKIIQQIERNMGRYRHDSVIHFLLENLSKQPLMIMIIIELDDHRFWEKHLRNIVAYLTVPQWWDDEDNVWAEIYEAFCYEFHLVLKWWSKSDFADDKLEDSFRRVKSWIAVNSGYRTGLTMEWPGSEAD